MRRTVPPVFDGRTVQAQRSTFIGAMAGRLANAYPVALRLPPGPVVYEDVASPATGTVTIVFRSFNTDPLPPDITTPVSGGDIYTTYAYGAVVGGAAPLDTADGDTSYVRLNVSSPPVASAPGATTAYTVATARGLVIGGPVPAGATATGGATAAQLRTEASWAGWSGDTVTANLSAWPATGEDYLTSLTATLPGPYDGSTETQWHAAAGVLDATTAQRALVHVTAGDPFLFYPNGRSTVTDSWVRLSQATLTVNWAA